MIASVGFVKVAEVLNPGRGVCKHREGRSTRLEIDKFIDKPVRSVQQRKKNTITNI